MKTFLTENCEVVFRNRNIATVSYKEALRQRLYNRLKLNRGEWFLSPSDGIAWIPLLSEKSNSVMIQSEIRRAILADTEVDAIESLTIEENTAARSLHIKFSVISKIGKIEGDTAL